MRRADGTMVISWPEEADLTMLVMEALERVVPGATFVPGESCLTCAPQPLTEAMLASPDKALREKAQEIVHLSDLRASAVKTSARGGHSRQSQYFANLSANKAQSGAFFDVTRLTEYFNPPPSGSNIKDRFKYFETNSIYQASHDNAGEPNYGTLARRIVESIQQMGFNRIAYEGKGTNCIAFSTPANQKGHRQLIVIGTPDHYYVPHPAMLPPKRYTVANGNRLGMMIRVMPRLNMKGVTDADVEYLRKLCDESKSGLKTLIGCEGSEIKANNIGILEYDKPDGTHVRLPYLLDWGTFAGVSPRRMAALMQHWEQDPDLEPYREAAKYLKMQTGPEHLLSDPQEMRLFMDANGVNYNNDPTRMAVLMAVFHEFRLTPQELAHVAASAHEALARHPGFTPGAEAYHALASAFATGMDHGCEHNPPAQPRGKLKLSTLPTPEGFLTQLYDRVTSIPAPQPHLPH